MIRLILWYLTFAYLFGTYETRYRTFPKIHGSIWLDIRKTYINDQTAFNIYVTIVEGTHKNAAGGHWSNFCKEHFEEALIPIISCGKDVGIINGSLKKYSSMRYILQFYSDTNPNVLGSSDLGTWWTPKSKE